MSVTRTLVAPSTTWLLVKISPSEVSTIPVPAALSSFPITTLTSTTAGSTLAAMVDELRELPPAPTPVDPLELEEPPEWP
jgi:hypothetical protein